MRNWRDTLNLLTKRSMSLRGLDINTSLVKSSTLSDLVAVNDAQVVSIRQTKWSSRFMIKQDEQTLPETGLPTRDPFR